MIIFSIVPELINTNKFKFLFALSKLNQWKIYALHKSFTFTLAYHVKKNTQKYEDEILLIRFSTTRVTQ